MFRRVKDWLFPFELGFSFVAVEGEILKSLGHVFVGVHESLYIYIYLCIFLQIHDIPVFLG
jgi:hypothetical protein